MHRLSPLPLIQLCLRQRILCCRNKVVVRWNRPAISRPRQYVENQPNSKPSTTFFTGALDFEGFASYSGLNNLSAKWAGKIQHAAESGAEAEGSCNFFHEKDFVA